MSRYDTDWEPGCPFDKHRHLCELCIFGLILWTGEEYCSPVQDDHHWGSCAKCRTKYGKRKVQETLAALHALDERQQEQPRREQERWRENDAPAKEPTIARAHRSRRRTEER